MNRRYKALVVDFGGVLTSPLQDAMAAFAAEQGIDFQDLVRAALGAYTGDSDSLVTDFETGRIPEDEFAAAFAKRLTEFSGVMVEPVGLVTRLFGELRLEEDMFALVGRARSAGYKTALCSNSWGMDLYPRARLRKLFDVIVISGEVGLRKPDPEIFSLTVAKLGLTPHECLFVDDHPGHLKSAKAAGMKTLLHRSPPESIAEVESLLEL
jgi:putative hydrolase of the HAD superfamily